ncbi:hypothetical protein C8J57DRAFT_1720151 [Mycena rebaudengoi]|nr:hypothetical protein C8J57DRAFT_1720151 [Mycena rebaudengoi]
MRGLKSFGVRLQLGHGPHGHCPNPVPTNNFKIIDYHARHAVALDFCGCCGLSHYNQLTDSRLLPSRSNPSQATIEILSPTNSFPCAVVCRTEQMVLKGPPVVEGGSSMHLARITWYLLSPPPPREEVAEEASSRAAVKVVRENMTDESLGWDPLCDTLAEWALETRDRMPRVMLEYPAEGFAYVTEMDRVQIPEDPEDANFVEGQSMDDIWSAVLEQQAAADEPGGDGAPPQHFLAIPVRDIMPALLGGCVGGSGDNSAAEMTRGQVWCREQMIKYDREAHVTFK